MKLIYYFATISLFLAFAYSVVQYIRRSNEDINEKYRLISFGIFLFVFFTDLKFLDTINKEFKYLIEFLLLSFSTYLFSLIFKNSDNKWIYCLFYSQSNFLLIKHCLLVYLYILYIKNIISLIVLWGHWYDFYNKRNWMIKYKYKKDIL